MLTSLITRIVVFSARRAWLVIALSLAAAGLGGWYTATHFAINTDIGKLLDSDEPWSRRDAAISAAFPQRGQMILAVIEAPSTELADAAADELAQALRTQPARFRAVDRPGGGAFFERNGLLFLEPAALGPMMQRLDAAGPLLQALAHDPSLRGLANTLTGMLGMPLQMGQVNLDAMAPVLRQSADTVEQVLAGKPAALSWWTLMGGTVPDTGAGTPAGPALSFVALNPVLDYSDLQAGADASAAVRDSAARLRLAERYGASLRLTGAQALADDEFASVKQGALLNGVVTVLVVILILWLALRSGRLIVAVLVSLFAGLAITAALGLAMVEALNMISVAFAVLFVGLGVDFGIQFGVRYRAERHRQPNLEDALRDTARGLAVPLTLAATATAAAFFCFLPTDYRGVAELGLIAGVGMVIALAGTLTLLPALIAVMHPGGGASAPGFAWMAPADAFFDRHRKAVLLVTCVVILAASPLLPHLRFDFDPLNLKDPQSESMATLRALRDAPQAGTNDVSVLAPSLQAAREQATRVAGLPEVDRVLTLQSFVPPDQDAKLPLIAATAQRLLPVLSQPPAPAAPDPERVGALTAAAKQLLAAAEGKAGAGADAAHRLAAALDKLAGADAAMRDRAEQALALPLRLSLARLRMALSPTRVTLASLPPGLIRDWQAPDGRALVGISPKLPPPGDPARAAALDRFVDAVQAVAPEATGGPISIRGSARTIMTSFAQAGAWAVLSITVLLWLTLRRFGDVLRTLVPLLVSAVVTLELCVALDIPLNFANVIALPLLLGIGVAFKIYYVIAWREGKTGLLQSSLTHAVLFSAATTAVAFGSLWLSHHAGTASMGKLLALSLVCTLIGAVFFQPVLMGRPRGKEQEVPVPAGGKTRP
jgi:hopanoid biosynthesis associated RND transporter like protein HpnN